MNILILNWRDIKNPKSGGAEIVTHEHAKYWVKKGHTVIWFTSCFKNAIKKETIDGFTVIREGNSTVYIHALLYYFKNKDIIDIVIDEIHGIPFFTPLYVKKPKIAFIHEVAREIWDYMYPFPLNKIGQLVEPIYFRFYRNIPFWTPSQSTIEDLASYGIPKKSCKNIVCPMLCKTLTKPPKKEKYPTFIFVSRLVKMKGVEDVILAFTEIEKKEKNATLWIVGTGEKEYVNHLKDMAKEKKIKFFGKVSEDKKIDLLKRAHILLHASVKEGWGLVVVEAASQGTPSVTYNVAGLRDSVIDNRTGILTKKNNPKNLASNALLLYRDKNKYKKFQNSCLAWAKSLSWGKAQRESLDLLTGVYKKYYEKD